MPETKTCEKIMPKTKTCKICHEEKQSDQFSHNNKQCKPCRIIKNHEYYLIHKHDYWRDYLSPKYTY